MGSKALERSGHRVVAYDARGHGASTPAPSPDAYSYEELGADLPRVLDDHGWSGRSSPARRWAPTRSCGWRSSSPSGSPASSSSRPPTSPMTSATRPRSRAGTRWPRACAAAASRASSRPTATPGCPRRGARRCYVRAASAWRARAPGGGRRRAAGRAALEALRRARGPWAIDVPAVVVAGRDEADPGHPFAVGEAYARADPGRRGSSSRRRASRRSRGRAASCRR